MWYRMSITDLHSAPFEANALGAIKLTEPLEGILVVRCAKAQMGWISTKPTSPSPVGLLECINQTANSASEAKAW